MDGMPVTRVSLLARLRDRDDADAWRQFVQVYGSVVYGFARKRGLQDADAADLMQEVLRAVSRSAGRLDYDPGRGTFRGWLYTVTRNKLYNFLDGRKNQPRGAGGPTTPDWLEEQPGRDTDPAAAFDREFERRLAAYAMDRIRGEFQEATWRAFWLTAVEGQSAAEAAAALGMSPGAVYVAKSRALARLREEVQHLQEE